MAWAKQPPEVHPSHAAVQYVGETGEFRSRMNDFARSAGFRGEPCNGHSGAYRWECGRREHLWVAFFHVACPLGQEHLGIGLRKWLEAVALEEHRRANGDIPLVNRLLHSGRHQLPDLGR